MDLEPFWEWGGDLVNSALDGWVSIEQEKAANGGVVNNGNQNNTIVDAEQTANTIPSTQNMGMTTNQKLAIGGGVLAFILVIVIVVMSSKK